MEQQEVRKGKLGDENASWSGHYGKAFYYLWRTVLRREWMRSMQRTSLDTTLILVPAGVNPGWAGGVQDNAAGSGCQCTPCFGLCGGRCSDFRRWLRCAAGERGGGVVLCPRACSRRLAETWEERRRADAMDEWRSSTHAVHSSGVPARDRVRAGADSRIGVWDGTCAETVGGTTIEPFLESLHVEGCQLECSVPLRWSQ